MNTSMVAIALEGGRLNALLIAALEHRLCDLLRAGPSTVGELAAKAGISPRGCQAVADGMVGMRLWSVADGRYQNSKMAEKLLCSDSPDFVGAEHVFLFRHWTRIFLDIGKYVASGKPPYAIDSPQTLEFWSQLTPAIAKNGRPVVAEAIRRFGLDTGAVALLDVGGGGSCLYGAALLAANPRATATQADWPHINAAARAVVDAQGDGARFATIDGDFHDTDFGAAAFDAVVISNIVHQESPDQNLALFRRVRRALKDGGRIILVDWFVEDGRTGPPPSLYFNLTMLLLTEEGKSYEKAEIGRLLQEAGFVDVTFDRTPAFETFSSARAGRR
ncbi:MAG: methyltransferase domain-containing protein [Gammaproteobacteria bacterium]|nr:methyltransferase domain-containing protein [Gammaproteobacteria bacterium]